VNKFLIAAIAATLVAIASAGSAHAVGSYFEIYLGKGAAALSTDPVASEKFYKMALAEALTGDDPEADPATARCGLAKAYIYQLRKEDARKLLTDGLKERVVKTRSRSDYPTRQAWELLGSICCELGDYKEAEDAYNKAILIAAAYRLESRVAVPLGLSETADGKKSDGLYHLVLGIQECPPVRQQISLDGQPYAYSFANPLDAAALGNYYLSQNVRDAYMPYLSFLFWDFQHRDPKAARSLALNKSMILALKHEGRTREEESVIAAVTDSKTEREKLRNWAQQFDFSREAEKQLLLDILDGNIEQFGYMSDQAQNARCNCLFSMVEPDNFDKNELFIKLCIQKARNMHQDTGLNFSQLLSWSAFIYIQKNDYQQALPLQEESMALRCTLAKQGIAQRAIDVSSDLQVLGSIYENVGKLDKAEIAYRSALTIWEKLDDERVRAQALHEYASFVDRRGRAAESKDLFQQYQHILSPWQQANRDKPNAGLKVYSSDAMITQWSCPVSR
jgi:tetratricopeptide (TPR) repeat protein